ncbi:MAG: helix-turn-helix domain-containing protein [Nocardioidaceae bacterium]
MRLQMLSLLTGTEMSAAEIARELEITQANASYHLRVLAAAGRVVEAGEEKIRGGIAKRYRHPWQNDNTPARTRHSAEDSELFLQALCQEMIRRHASVTDGPSLSVDAEMWLDPADWENVVTSMRQAGELIHHVARPPRTKGTVHVSMSTVAFRMEADTAR